MTNLEYKILYETFKALFKLKIYKKYISFLLDDFDRLKLSCLTINPLAKKIKWLGIIVLFKLFNNISNNS